YTRIPLTPPRYGVWMVHCGIILLILGVGVYYNQKIEGQIIIPIGQTVTRFYDSEARMLYVRVNGQDICGHTLPGLPRFGTYTPELGNAGYLGDHGLSNLVPTYRGRPLAEMLGLKDLAIDIVGYYPYAQIVDEYTDDGNKKGIRFTISAPHMGITQTEYLLCDDPNHSQTVIGSSEVRVIPFSDSNGLDGVAESAQHIHTLDVTLPGYHEKMSVSPGNTYKLGNTGYSITFEGYDPNWPAMDGQKVQLITLMVHRPGGDFRRQVIMGRDEPTDWKLNVPGAGPMGQRETQPLDNNLHITYKFSDPFNLSPSDQNVERHTILTLANSNKFTDVCVAADHAPSVTQVDGSGDLVMALGAIRMKVGVVMKDHLRVSEDVVPVPKGKRTQQGGQSGAFEVLLARVRSGNWSKTIPVPFTQFAEEPQVNWTDGTVDLPGTNVELELQLSDQFRPLPAAITLDRFQLVHYPGGDDASLVQRDFKSYLTIEDLTNGQFTRGVAHMNHPVYYASGDWLFFQAAWDSNGQRWSILGVGNRPGIWTMISGCALIFVGLMYAFYLKPVIIRRMKANALEKARRRAKAPEVASLN
ncbi:MAG TPA: hypothetical protein VG722_08450, partial [Tepidisphaeraceae bacterium]|nr:hypothetical protein [Tepidisphaeraceae bacterium]